MISHRITTNKYSPPAPFTRDLTIPLPPVVYMPGQGKKEPSVDKSWLIETPEEYEKFLKESAIQPGDIIAYDHAIKNNLDSPELYVSFVLGFIKFEHLNYSYSDRPKHLMVSNLPNVGAYPSSLVPYMRPDDGQGMSPLPKERQELIKSNAVLSNRIEQIKRSARNIQEAAFIRESL